MLTTNGSNASCAIGGILDAVAWGSNSSACFETTGLGTVLGNIIARRDTTRGCRDSNNNPNDFVQTSTFTPRNKQSTPVSCLCP